MLHTSSNHPPVGAIAVSTSIKHISPSRRQCYYLRMDADSQPLRSPLPADQVALAVEVFRMLADGTRIQILWALVDREMSVNDLAATIGKPGPSVSQHLAKLRMARLVRTRRDGTQIFYQLENDHVRQLIIDARAQRRTRRPGGPRPPPDAASRPAATRPAPGGGIATTRHDRATAHTTPTHRSPHDDDHARPPAHDAIHEPRRITTTTVGTRPRRMRITGCARCSAVGVRGRTATTAPTPLIRRLEASTQGIRAVKISLVALGVTALLQVVVVAISGSVALLADTIHNFSDALTAVPLWIAFVLSRRAASRRYTYGFGRVEDLAGLFIVAMIALSAVLAGWEADQPVDQPGAGEQPRLGRRGRGHRVRRQRTRCAVPDPGRQPDRVRRAGRRRVARPHRRADLAGGGARRGRGRAGLAGRRPDHRAGDHRGDPGGAAHRRPGRVPPAAGRGRPRGWWTPPRRTLLDTPGVPGSARLQLRWLGSHAARRGRHRGRPRR